jgi:hypothetical protein
MNFIEKLSLGLIFVAALTLFSPAARADSVSYTFTMDTTSLSGTYGFIDMQFMELGIAPGPGVYNDDTTATVSNFETDAVLDPTSLTGAGDEDGDVTGTLPGTVTFIADGDGAFNDYDEGLTFGDSISFTLTLSGQGVTTPICPGTPGTQCSAPEFTLDFLDAGQDAYLFTNDPTGSTATGWAAGGVGVNLDTTTTTYTSPGPGDNAADLTIASNAPAGSVPEPSALLLLGIGLIGVFALARKAGCPGLASGI